MTGIRLTLMVLLTLVLQVAAVNRMELWGIRPDLTVLLVVLLGVRFGPMVGLLVGFALGLLQDLLVPATLGMNMLAKTLVGYTVGKLTGNLAEDVVPIYALVVGLAVLAHDAIYLLAYTRLDLPRFFLMYLPQSVPSALYTVAVGVLVLLITAALGGGALMRRGEEYGR